MKSIVRIVLGIICLLVAVIFTFRIMLVDNTVNEDYNAIIDTEDVSSIIDGKNSQADKKINAYIVRAYNNNLAVFEEGEVEPYRIYDTDIRILPESDREKLEKGIRVESETDLRRLLEDYTS